MFRVYCDSSKNVDLIILDSQLCTNTAANIPTAYLAMTFRIELIVVTNVQWSIQTRRIKDYFKSALPIHIWANTSLSDEKRMES